MCQRLGRWPIETKGLIYLGFVGSSRIGRRPCNSFLQGYPLPHVPRRQGRTKHMQRSGYLSLDEFLGANADGAQRPGTSAEGHLYHDRVARSRRYVCEKSLRRAKHVARKRWRDAIPRLICSTQNPHSPGADPASSLFQPKTATSIV
jgi:hypothetical protein